MGQNRFQIVVQIDRQLATLGLDVSTVTPGTANSA